MKFAIFLLLMVSVGGAKASADMKAVLRWGADIESGAPFSYKDPDQPKKIVGFEAELVEALGLEMGRDVEFVQNSWDGLIEGLKRNDYDIVVNGLEITSDRAKVVRFSRPYYVTTGTLVVAKTNHDIHEFSDLEGKRVGTLAGALPHRILSEQSFPMQVVTYSEEIHAYNDLAMGRLDAVFMDDPIALYYGRPNKDLKVVGEPMGRLEYGIATRLDEAKFGQEVDQALSKVISSGKMRAILERWGLWNEQTAKEFGMSVTAESPATAYDAYVSQITHKVSFKERAERYISFLPLLAKGALMTLEISMLSMVLAMLVGLMVALTRLYGPLPGRWLAVGFVEILRGTPLLIQLLLIFYGLPRLGIRLDPFLAAVIGLGLNYGACEAENYRAGILSIPLPQMDAARALGFSRGQALKHIILPQAIRVVIPPVTNDFIALLKDSSLVSVITMVELTTTYGQLASTYFDYLGIGILTAAIYFLIGLPFVRLSRHLELRGRRA